MARGNNHGAHSVDVIDDTVDERMALYDALPVELRDVMKALSFNYSAVSMREWAETRGVPAVMRYMVEFDRRHWREFWREDMGKDYPL